MANLHRNEAVRLAANFLSALAVSVLTIAIFTPLAVMIYGSAQIKAAATDILGFGAICAGMAMLLHLSAQVVLWSLRDAESLRSKRQYWFSLFSARAQRFSPQGLWC